MSSALTGFISFRAESATAGPFAQRMPRTRMYDPLLEEEEQGLAREIYKSTLGALDAASGLFGLLNPNRYAEDVPAKFFEQKLDPSNILDSRTFKQRFYVYSGHAKGPDSPVVLYIGGEAELSPRRFMGRYTEDLAETLHAHIVAVEHRYYGETQPFDQLTPANLQYLSTDHAIADLVRFQGFAMTQLGLKGKWLAVGGSYPGSLSAYYRLKHPELVVGALASSAPVEARNAFEEYDSHVTEVVGPVCAEALRAVNVAAEAALANGRFADFKALFNSAGVVDDNDFLYVLADVAAFAVQYGKPEPLCKALTTAADPVAAYAQHVREFFAEHKTTAVDFSPAIAAKLGARESSGMRQWYYQSCREYGYWQDAHHDPKRSVRSARLNAAYDRGICQRFFALPEIADEAAMNARFYEPLQDPTQASRIFFTNGSTDPWSELSISHERGNATNANTAAYMIVGASHCSDLRAQEETDSAALRESRKLFTEMASGWTAL